MAKNKDLTPLFNAIESVLDMAKVERILLLLEKDKTDFVYWHKLWMEEKENLSIIEKINPFSERDQKGEILKMRVKLDDLINLYTEERKTLVNMTVKAIYSIPAFVAKERMRELYSAIESISAGGNMVFGRNDALKKRKKVNESFVSVYGTLYRDCPKLHKLSSGFMNYLFAPFHLPSELKR